MPESASGADSGRLETRMCSWCRELRSCSNHGRGWRIWLEWPAKDRLVVVLICPRCREELGDLAECR
jgi:hypothetical protein